MMSTPSSITSAVVTALRTLNVSPALNETTCYAIAAPAYIEGQDELVIQVCPGSVVTDSAGRGAQEGGSLERAVSITVAVWYRLKLDMHGHSVYAMMSATKNLMGVCDSVRALLALTWLKGEIDEPLWYVGESDTEVFDADGGVYRRDMQFSGYFAAALPTALTYS